MVLDFYGLREQPFGATPDSRYLFASETHREALASLLYGVESGRGFMALIAKPGMGKTTLLFRGLDQLREKGRIVFLFQAISTPLDFLRALLADLDVKELNGGLFELQTKLNEILVENARRGDRLVVVIDETQNLDESVLELVRMLSNFETQQEKLIQIILSGQPQLATKLALPSLVQLRQRISIIAQLEPFSPEMTAEYVNHRLRIAGYDDDRLLFTSAAMRLIASYSQGIPRTINNLCFNSLSLGCAMHRRTIDADIIREVIADLDLGPLAHIEPVDSRFGAAPVSVAHQALRGPLGIWMLRTAMAVIACLALSGLVIRSDSRGAVLAHTTLIPDAEKPILAKSPPKSAPPVEFISHEVPSPLGNASKMSASHPTMRSEDAENRILVPVGMTLDEVCTAALRNCHSRELNAIRGLGHWLSNSNHLAAGRELRIPSSTELKGASQAAADSPLTHSYGGIQR